MAGTELGVFVSFNDGDDWQSLQLNLPPTSNRDVAFKDNDLVVATHGRGFWVLDDISSLRQAMEVAATSHLFKPGEAILYTQPTDDGTPTQKDEAFAENPPTGAIIDYYLKADATGPVVLEILDGGGSLVRRYSSVDPAPPIDVNKLATNAIWQRVQETLATGAGMHRIVWDFRPQPPAASAPRPGGGGGGGRGGAIPVLPGRYSVRLTVNGNRIVQPLTVKPDPRSR